MLAFIVFLSISNPSPTLAAPRCVVPSTGNWVVIEDCDLERSATASGNVLVNNRAILRILDNRSLGIDFSSSRLQVSPGSKVLISPNGKLLTAVKNGRSGNGGGDGSSSSSIFPPPPEYIKFGSRTRLVLDFNTPTRGDRGFRIEFPEPIPGSFLDYLPQSSSGISFPENFCGFRVKNPGHFVWLDSAGKVVDDEFFNSAPDNGPTIRELFGDQFDFMGVGIEFAGPIGACEGEQKEWKFPFPLTTGDSSPSGKNLGFVAVERDLRLVIELFDDIDFIKDAGSTAKPIDIDKLFGKDIREQLKKLIKQYNKTFDFSSAQEKTKACKAIKYVNKLCEAGKTSEFDLDNCAYDFGCN